MKFRVEERSFSAAEAERYAGVAQDQQRDWRRRGFVPPPEPGRRARFSLLQLCILSLVKAQTDTGKAVSGAFVLAKFTAPALHTQIELCPLAVRIEGTAIEEKARPAWLRALANVSQEEEPTRYVFFPTPDPSPSPMTSSEPEEEDRLASAYHVASLQEIEERVPKAWLHGTLFDLEGFAMKLALQVGEPLITYTLEEGSE